LRALMHTEKKREVGTKVDPKIELSFTRVIELCTEAVPLTMVQMGAMITPERTSKTCEGRS